MTPHVGGPQTGSSSPRCKATLLCFILLILFFLKAGNTSLAPYLHTPQSPGCLQGLGEDSWGPWSLWATDRPTWPAVFHPPSGRGAAPMERSRSTLPSSGRDAGGRPWGPCRGTRGLGRRESFSLPAERAGAVVFHVRRMPYLRAVKLGRRTVTAE